MKNNYISSLVVLFIILLLVFMIITTYRNNNIINDNSKSPYSSIDNPLPYERLPSILSSCIKDNNCGLQEFNSLLL